ncbi:MAG: hypothetical protein COA73_12865 [Candidatus Hydrogenedentota bacterium]|nr:MAG: hypothetical protein COA73_12865 [Candidatus Hydrogenedentota bacterium]
MSSNPNLPPGQHEISTFPRFGLLQFAYRYPRDTKTIKISITGGNDKSTVVADALMQLPRVKQVSDFHCVTTWSRRGLTWSGFRFRDFYTEILKPLFPGENVGFILLKGQDGYRTSLPLEDLLAEDVLLADTLDGKPLTVEHGAPLRLVAPSHYGYKNIKHLDRIEIRSDGNLDISSGFRFMSHPRARVAHEERGTGVPGWMLRILYRPLVKPTIRRFQKAMTSYDESNTEKPLDE